MRRIYLQKHDIFYAEQMSALISNLNVRQALALTEEETTVEAMSDFIREMQLEEMMGNHISRMIMDENFELIGVITLHNIDEVNNTSHISTWFGYEFWGLGYNALAKKEMLYYAFHELGLQTVFAGARIENFRSRKAQRKLPYMTFYAEREYPEELVRLERRERTKCLLNAVKRTDFINWYYHSIAI